MNKLLIVLSIFISLNAFSQTNAVKIVTGGSPFITNGASYTTQTYTSGATVTISTSSNWLIVNPDSVVGSLTITLPANPNDQEEVTISFGGDIAGGDNVVTSLTIAANSGQTLAQNFTPTSFQSGESVTYKYDSSTTKWYAK